MHRAALVASLILTVLIIGGGIASNHSSTIVAKLMEGDWTYRLQVALRIIPIWAIGCWPWIVALLQSSNSARRIPAIAFSALALALAAYFYSGISTAPSEGVGWYVFIYYLVVWGLYLLMLLLRRRESP